MNTVISFYSRLVKKRIASYAAWVTTLSIVFSVMGFGSIIFAASNPYIDQVTVAPMPTATGVMTTNNPTISFSVHSGTNQSGLSTGFTSFDIFCDNTHTTPDATLNNSSTTGNSLTIFVSDGVLSTTACTYTPGTYNPLIIGHIERSTEIYAASGPRLYIVSFAPQGLPTLNIKVLASNGYNSSSSDINTPISARDQDKIYYSASLTIPKNYSPSTTLKSFSCGSGNAPTNPSNGTLTTDGQGNSVVTYTPACVYSTTGQNTTTYKAHIDIQWDASGIIYGSDFPSVNVSPGAAIVVGITNRIVSSSPGVVNVNIVAQVFNGMNTPGFYQVSFKRTDGSVDYSGLYDSTSGVISQTAKSDYVTNFANTCGSNCASAPIFTYSGFYYNPNATDTSGVVTIVIKPNFTINAPLSGGDSTIFTIPGSTSTGGTTTGGGGTTTGGGGGANQQITASLSATPTSGSGNFTSVLTATPGGTATGPFTYSYYCDGNNLSQTNAYVTTDKGIPNDSYTCSYAPVANTTSYAAKVVISQTNNAGVNATATTTVTANAVPTITASLSANPSSGTGPFNSVLTATRTGGSAPGPFNYDYYCDGATLAHTTSSTNANTDSYTCGYPLLNTNKIYSPYVIISQSSLGVQSNPASTTVQDNAPVNPGAAINAFTINNSNSPAVISGGAINFQWNVTNATSISIKEIDGIAGNIIVGGYALDSPVSSTGVGIACNGNAGPNDVCGATTAPVVTQGSHKYYRLNAYNNKSSSWPSSDIDVQITPPLAVNFSTTKAAASGPFDSIISIDWRTASGGTSPYTYTFSCGSGSGQNLVSSASTWAHCHYDNGAITTTYTPNVTMKDSANPANQQTFTAQLIYTASGGGGGGGGCGINGCPKTSTLFCNQD